MTDIPLQLPDRQALGTTPAIRSIVRDWWKRLRQSWRYAAALRELQTLDPRTLKDVGLHRGDLHGVAYATARCGAFGRFGAVRVRRVDLADLPRCVLSGRLLGLATVAWLRPGTAEIGLIVRSDMQRRGLGATLLAHVIKDARGAGFRLLVAQVDQSNVPIRRLARRFGFELGNNPAGPAEAQLALAA